jgi:proteasome-associated ATPase
MKKSATENPIPDDLFSFDNNLSLDDRVSVLQDLRAREKVCSQLDRWMLERLCRQHRGLLEAKQYQEQLKELLDKLGATPWFPALLLQTCSTPLGPRAIVQFNNSRRLVGFADGLDAASVGPGNEVFLANELNVIVCRSPNDVPRGGETAVFERKTDDGRLVLRHHDDEIVVDAARSLADVTIHPGDHVRFDRNSWLALERIDRSKGSHLFLEDTPVTTFAEIGGLDTEIARIKCSINLHVFHGDTARKYGLRRKGSLLLAGPSGTGKTMIARALANWLATLSPSRRSRFMNIKPAGLHSMWYGQSEANYREAFRVARAAGESEPTVPVVMFFDEVDAAGMSRGRSNAHVDDRVLTAFMAELDGLTGRGNIIVIGATNRRDALDPALLRPGRLGDLVLEVPRPKMKAAGDILARHLRQDIPYGSNGHSTSREEIIAAVLSRIYAPNGEGELASLQFRDGSRRSVRAADLVSGAIIANIVNSAIERACTREVETTESGLRTDDVLTAVAEEFEAAVRVLTPGNCRYHLTDLPQDMDVVSVAPVVRKVKQPHRYLNVEAAA